MPAAMLPAMASFPPDTHPDPDAPARCPRTLPGGHARCMALVLVRDATEHEHWHDDLETALTAPVEVHGGLEAADWPVDHDAPVVPGL